MQKTIPRKLLSVILCVGLFAAMALTTTGCTANQPGAPETSTAISTAPESEASQAPEGTVLGEGETEFAFLVVDGEGAETRFTIRTDETTVGAALLELGLIEGDESEYGLYVKTVNGITVDYDTDGKYWAFYIDDEYAMTGVDATDVAAGSTYSFVVE